MRVIGKDGQSLGILSRDEALRVAQASDLDLVMVNLKAEPPVVKIVDWGKYNYQKKKRQQQNRQSRHVLKQMRLNVKIGEYDLDVKLRKIYKFLEEGNKVKLTIVLKGREMEHKDLAFELAQKIIQKLADVGITEQAPKLNGRQINILIRSSKNV